MHVGLLVILLPLVTLVVSRPNRTLAGIGAAALLTWLNLWWLLPILNFNPDIVAHSPILNFPNQPIVLGAGHFVFLVLFLVAVGLFSPQRGSPGDLAVHAALRGDYLAAGSYWMEAGSLRRAYRCFIRAQAWARAADVARSRGQMRRAAALLTREGGHSLASAAQILSRQGNEAEAQRTWARYGQYLVAANQSELAIEPFLRAGDTRRAIHAVEMAADAHRITASQVEAALRAAREAKRPQLAAQVALAAGRLREAGDLFLSADLPLDAARAFERAGDPMRAAEALRLAGHTDQAARLRAQRLAASGQLEQAAAEYEAAGMAGDAAAVLVQLGRFGDAIELYKREGAIREAAEIARDHGDRREAAKLFSEVEDWPEAGNAWMMADEPFEAARCFERGGDYARALESYGLAHRIPEQAKLLAQLGRVEEGFLVLYQNGDFAGARDLLSLYGGTFPVLAEPLAKLGEWLQSQGDTSGAIAMVQRATSGMSVARTLLPALYTLADLFEIAGDLRTAEGTFQKIVDYDYAFRDAAQRLQMVAARRQQDEADRTSGVQKLPSSDSGPQPVADVASRYVLEQELGRGGMGIVYRARDSRLGRVVAIKVLHSRQHTPEALRRFAREARAAAALSHPAIVHIYDFDQGFGSYFISMEFVSGPTLNQLIREQPAYVRANLLNLMRQIVDGVGYAHSQRVLHRDLKPANMVLADGKQIKILDFGIARRMDELDLSVSGVTGTPYYMAPEQILGEEPDERADVYSLGVTFFQMATGILPFATGNILRAHLEQPPPDPLALAPDLNPELAQLVLRCLAKDPNHRPRHGEELLGALGAIREATTG